MEKDYIYWIELNFNLELVNNPNLLINNFVKFSIAVANGNLIYTCLILQAAIAVLRKILFLAEINNALVEKS